MAAHLQTSTSGATRGLKTDHTWLKDRQDRQRMKPLHLQVPKWCKTISVVLSRFPEASVSAPGEHSWQDPTAPIACSAIKSTTKLVHALPIALHVSAHSAVVFCCTRVSDLAKSLNEIDNIL